MKLDIEKAIMFQKSLDMELTIQILSTVNSYDTYERSLDKIEISLAKHRSKAFCENKEDLIRYIETCKDMPTPDIDLLQIISETFYEVKEDESTYDISISVEGIRGYIEDTIAAIVNSDQLCNYDKLSLNEKVFAKKMHERYLIKKYFKHLNDRGRVPVEFEIPDVIRYMVEDENNTSYDKFSNLKKFKIDRIVPLLQKILGLDIEALTINSGRNTDRLYMECVDRIDAKKYSRQVKENYSMKIVDVERIIKQAIGVVEGDQKILIKILGENEYSLTLGEIEFTCVVSKIVNYKVDLMVKYKIKDKVHELIISEDILKQPVMYTAYGEKALEYYLFVIAACIDESATFLSGMLIGKEFETNLAKTDYKDTRKRVGPIFNNNGNSSPCVLIKMDKNVIEEVNSKGEQLVKINVNIEPRLRVNVSKMLKSIGENADEYLKKYADSDFNSIHENGVPYIDTLQFIFNVQREESYIRIPNIKCLDFVSKELKKEVEWDSKCILEEDDILVISNTEKEYLGLCVERYVHSNLAAICMQKGMKSNLSKDILGKLKEHYEIQMYVDTEYLEEDIVNYGELI